MSWSYSGNPANSELDKVRYMTGDTIPQDPLLQDEEILYTISKNSNEFAMAADCCEAIASKFARMCDRRLGHQYLFASQQYEHFNDLQKMFKQQASIYNAPYAGGLSETEEQTDIANTDLKQPIFGRNMMTNPWVGYPYNEK